MSVLADTIIDEIATRFLNNPFTTDKRIIDLLDGKWTPLWTYMERAVEHLSDEDLGKVVAAESDEFTSRRNITPRWKVKYLTWPSRFDDGRSILRQIATAVIIARLYDLYRERQHDLHLKVQSAAVFESRH